MRPPGQPHRGIGCSPTPARARLGLIVAAGASNPGYGDFLVRDGRFEPSLLSGISAYETDWLMPDRLQDVDFGIAWSSPPLLVASLTCCARNLGIR
jgi:hypothetical protein